MLNILQYTNIPKKRKTNRFCIFSTNAFAAAAKLQYNLTGPLHISASTIDVFVANVVSWVLAVTFAYITNKLFVFESYSWNPKFVLKELSLFLSARIATGLIEIFGVPFLVSHGFNQAIFGLEGSVCKITMSFLVVLLNYVFSKLVIFKKDRTEA